MSTPIDPAKLDKLAELAVKVGLGLEPGQDLFMTAPTGALPLARRIAAAAYRAGAGLVTTIFSDEEMTLARYRHGHDASFDRAPGWLYEGLAKAFEDNTARLAISGDNPMLLGKEDPDRVGRANRANSKAYRPALTHIVNHDINWSIVPYPGTSWAREVFPGEPEEVAVRKLADAVFAATRVDAADPVAAWAEQDGRLRERQTWLTEHNFAALRYPGPGTELTSGSPRTTPGAAASAIRATASPATPTSRPRKSSPPRIVSGSTASSPPPSP